MEITEEVKAAFVSALAEGMNPGGAWMPTGDDPLPAGVVIIGGVRTDFAAALSAVAPLIAEQARREEREACAALVDYSAPILAIPKGNVPAGCEALAAAIRSRGDQSPPPALSKDGIRIHCPDMSPGWDPTVGYQGGCHLVECGCGAEGPAVPDDYDEAVRLWNAGYRASDQEAVDRRSGDQSAALDDIAKFDQDEGLI